MGSRLQGKFVPILSMGGFALTRIIPGSAGPVWVPMPGTAAGNPAAAVLAGLGHP
jgi:hypothetical protein